MLRAARDAAAVARTELHADIQTFRSGDAGAHEAPDTTAYAATDLAPHDCDAAPDQASDPAPDEEAAACAYETPDARSDAPPDRQAITRTDQAPDRQTIARADQASKPETDARADAAPGTTAYTGALAAPDATPDDSHVPQRHQRWPGDDGPRRRPPEVYSDLSGALTGGIPAGAYVLQPYRRAALTDEGGTSGRV